MAECYIAICNSKWQVTIQTKQCSSKLICALKFISFRHISTYLSTKCTYMKEKQLRKSMNITSKIHKIFTWITKIELSTLTFRIWICWCIHVSFLGFSNPSIYWNARSDTLDKLALTYMSRRIIMESRDGIKSQVL